VKRKTEINNTIMYIFEYKELIKNLVISDLKTKYSSSVLGFAWSMLNPLMMMLVLYFVFNNVFNMKQEHFALYILIGLTGWRFLHSELQWLCIPLLEKPVL